MEVQMPMKEKCIEDIIKNSLLELSCEDFKPNQKSANNLEIIEILKSHLEKQNYFKTEIIDQTSQSLLKLSILDEYESNKFDVMLVANYNGIKISAHSPNVFTDSKLLERPIKFKMGELYVDCSRFENELSQLLGRIARYAFRDVNIDLSYDQFKENYIEKSH